MQNSSFSPIEALNAAIKTHNPFSKNAIVKAQDVWGQGFPDVESLNAHASDAVFQAIEQVKSLSSKDKVTSVALTAARGVGKTHTISRIRHRLERKGGALFVYASADEYVDLDLIKYQFQQTLADSLKHSGSKEVMQWQEVATAMANEALQASKPDAPPLEPKKLIKNFDRTYDKKVAENKKNLMDDLVEKAVKVKPHSDPDIIRAILWTLSEKQALFAIKWLSGQAISNAKADELGLPQNSNKTNQDREAEALNNVKQILSLVSSYQPVLLCFDEIDVLNDCDEAGNETPEVIADLVKRLYDTLHQSELSQGVVILTVMMPDTWSRTIKELKGGIPDRVATSGKAINLFGLNSDSTIELVKRWLAIFYNEQNLNPENLLYPFEESQLRELGKEKPPVRNVLRWCAENFKVKEVEDEFLKLEPVNRFKLALQKEMEIDRGNYLEDNSLIAKALFFGFGTLENKTLEGVNIEEVTEKFGLKKGKKDKYVNFRIIGKENGKEVKIGVVVLQDMSGNTVQAVLKRLLEYESLDITRGCLVRSKEINKSWKKACDNLTQLTSQMGGEFVELIEEQVRPLVALMSVYEKLDIYHLTEEEILDFITQENITFDNLLLREILSDPSGQIPEGFLKEDDDIFSELAGENDDYAQENTTIYDELTNADRSKYQTGEDDISDLYDDD